MIFPVPGSFVIPTLGVPTPLVSLDAHAVLTAIACVGMSLTVSWAVMALQRRSVHRPRSRDVVPQLPVPSHA
jgi:hypothetical protein